MVTGFDFAKRRAELQAAMDLNAIRMGELAAENREYQREFRRMELHERRERDRVTGNLNPPAGVIK
jgi:hypothetical protein